MDSRNKQQLEMAKVRLFGAIQPDPNRAHTMHAMHNAKTKAKPTKRSRVSCTCGHQRRNHPANGECKSCECPIYSATPR